MYLICQPRTGDCAQHVVPVEVHALYVLSSRVLAQVCTAQHPDSARLTAPSLIPPA